MLCKMNIWYICIMIVNVLAVMLLTKFTMYRHHCFILVVQWLIDYSILFYCVFNSNHSNITHYPQKLQISHNKHKYFEALIRESFLHFSNYYTFYIIDITVMLELYGFVIWYNCRLPKCLHELLGNHWAEVATV